MMMTVTQAIEGRRSTRAFTAQPVPRELVAEILTLAARAPSGGNLQPWHVDVLAGDALAALKDKAKASLAAHRAGEDMEFAVYPPTLDDPWRERRSACGEQLYASLAIARTDRGARLGQFAKNFDMFGAPVGLFLSIERRFDRPQWAHLGMFMQNVMLLAAERGLATCPQEAWALVGKTVSDAFAVPPERLFYCGIALGHADAGHPINQWRTERAPLEDFASFRGFAQ